MGLVNERWGQFLFLVVIISSFFYFILQADVEEDFKVDLQDELQEKLSISKINPKSINQISVEEQMLRMKNKNFKPVQLQGLAPILNLILCLYSICLQQENHNTGISRVLRFILSIILGHAESIGYTNFVYRLSWGLVNSISYDHSNIGHAIIWHV